MPRGSSEGFEDRKSTEEERNRVESSYALASQPQTPLFLRRRSQGGLRACVRSRPNEQTHKHTHARLDCPFVHHFFVGCCARKWSSPVRMLARSLGREKKKCRYFSTLRMGACVLERQFLACATRAHHRRTAPRNAVEYPPFFPRETFPLSFPPSLLIVCPPLSPLSFPRSDSLSAECAVSRRPDSKEGGSAARKRETQD